MKNLFWTHKSITNLVLIILSATFLFTLPYICSADNEPNNTCSTAEELILDYSGSGQLRRNGSDEFDFFYFTVPLDGTVTIIKSGNRISATLYNSNCSSVLATGDSITSPVVSGITYKIRLQATSNGNRSYTLTVSYIPIAPIAEYRFDECQYTGSGFEAQDETGVYNAQAENGVNSEIPGVVNRFADMQTNTHSFRPTTTIPLTSSWSISVWFKMPFVSSQRYHVLGAMAGGNDLLYVDRNSNYRWGVYTATPSSQLRNGTFRFGTLANGWHHLVLVGNTGTTSLYINGIFQDNVTLQSNGQFDYIGTSFDGYGTTGAQGFGLPLDEFIIYNQTISPSLINLIYNNQLIGNNWDGTSRTSSNCSAIDHYEIHHDGSALTCAPESVTIKACANADCSLLYTTSTDVTLSPAGWIGGDNKTFTGSADFELRHTIAEPVTLGISSSSPTASVTCFQNGISGDCTVTFNESGFLFTIPVQTSCLTSGPVTISAVQKDDATQQCVPAFANRTEVITFTHAINPAPASPQPILLNGTDISITPAISLDFDNNGQSTFTVHHDDAGEIQLNTQFDGSGQEAGLVMLGNETFVVKPDHFQLAVTKSDGSTVLNNTTSSGTPIEAAGNLFRITAQAVCADNTVTTNYIPTNAQLWVERTGPAVGGGEGTLALPNLTTPTSFTSSLSSSPSWHNVSSLFGNGRITDPSLTYASASYSEVGLITLHIKDTDYFSSTISDNTTPIGRFIPDHFIVSITPDPPTLSDSCIVGGFTYLGEIFNFATNPNITITAINAATPAAITRNYDCGSFWKLPDPLNLTYTYTDSSTSGLSITPLSNTINPAAGDTSDCSGSIQVTLSDNFTYIRPPVSTPVPPFVASIDLEITQLQLTDSDNICYDTGTGCQNFTSNLITGTTMRHGKIQVFDNFGPETEDISSSPFHIQYWNDFDFDTTFEWGPNTDDDALSCTNETSITFCTNNPNHTVDIDISSLASGAGTLTVGHDASNAIGTVRVCPTAPTDLTSLINCSSANEKCGDFTFGIYRGNDRIINWREIVR